MHGDSFEATPPVKPEFIELAGEVLGLLRDPTRIRILLALEPGEELAVGESAKIVEKSPSGVSQHLARLSMARMVTTRAGTERKCFTRSSPATPRGLTARPSGRRITRSLPETRSPASRSPRLTPSFAPEVRPRGRQCRLGRDCAASCSDIVLRSFRCPPVLARREAQTTRIDSWNAPPRLREGCHCGSTRWLRVRGIQAVRCRRFRSGGTPRHRRGSVRAYRRGVHIHRRTLCRLSRRLPIRLG